MTWAGLEPPYRTIVADPPWPVVSTMAHGGRRARPTRQPYSTMPLADIAALPVRELAGSPSALFLWVPAALNRRGAGVRVVKAWGFRDVAELVWAKPNLGFGAFPRICHELLIVGTRGTGALAAARRDVPSVQRWRQLYGTNGGKTHSAKPPAAYDLIEASSPGPYVELFARNPRLGWDAWGWGWEGAPLG